MGLLKYIFKKYFSLEGKFVVCPCPKLILKKFNNINSKSYLNGKKERKKENL